MVCTGHWVPGIQGEERSKCTCSLRNVAAEMDGPSTPGHSNDVAAARMARKCQAMGDRTFITTAKTIAQLLNGLDFLSMAINGEPMCYRED